MNRAFIHLSQLFQSFPRALIQAFKVDGWSGVNAATCSYLLAGVPFPFRLGSVGSVRTLQEVRNYLDNIAFGELRWERVESCLRLASEPVVVDLGVNVGISIRWWLHLNPRARVIGIDMLQEALDFTTTALKGSGVGTNWTPICAGVSDEPQKERAISYEDPLEGTTSLQSSTGSRQRTIRMDTLDHLLQGENPPHIDLLKCDIEGYGGLALKGAPATLSKTRFVVAETHDETETRLMTDLLKGSGFGLIRISGRSMWWENQKA